MKKNNSVKVLVIIAFVCILIGALLLGAGLVKGGSMRYLSINTETVSWWPFSNQSIGMNFDVFDDDYGSVEKYEEVLGDVHSVEINADAADITIQRGNENKVFYKVKKKNNVSIHNDNGKLAIAIEHQNRAHNFTTEITLQLKESTYDAIMIDSKMGDVDVESVQAKAINVQMKLGDVNLKNIVSENLIVDQKCGEIDVEGVLLNTTTITNKLGETSVEVRGNRDEYRYEVNTNMGDAEVLGVDYEMSANIKAGNNLAKNVIIIDNKMGDIEFEIH